jgi:threonine dehydrogenase-like Zn-dependent dehydrogenase
VDTTDAFASDQNERGELPFVDEHTIRIAASRELVWTALQRYVATSLRVGVVDNGTPRWKGNLMRATLIYGAGDVRVENVPDPALKDPGDAVMRVLRSCICGSDLWPYRSKPATEQGNRIGHEFLGVVEEIGSDVSGLKPGDVVVAPFVWADNTCDFCQEGLQTSCRRGGQWGVPGVDGGQGEAVRVPQAQGTLVKLPVDEDSTLLPSLLTLSDVFSTGHHCAVTAGVNPRTTVTVIGDGTVGLSAVLAAKRLGAKRIILMGRHKDRTDLGREFGATDVIAARGEEGVEKVRELTRGDGTHTVLECVGLKPAIETAFAVVRAGGVAPARAYIEELLPDVLEGRIEPRRVFDRTISLDEVPGGYHAMARREALKVLIRP